jgi:uncharacterized protein (TIGR00369 family)
MNKPASLDRSERIRPPKSPVQLERQLRWIKNELPPPPVAELVGFRIVEADLGHAVFEMQSEPRHANPMGTLHGGIICDLADAAMGCAMASSLEEGESFTTLDLTTKFFKPIWNARLKAVGRLTKRTRSLGLVECEVTDESGSLVAKVFSSCMVLRGDEARGR